MKYFKKDYILKAINEMGKVWNDSFLTCLCVHKELHLKDDTAKDCWHQINKDYLKNDLAYYFDLYEKPLRPQHIATGDYLSIIFAQQYESLIPPAEICYLAAICFRKQGIPENINDVSSLKDYLVKEFYLPPHFQSRLKNTLSLFPDFTDQSVNEDVVETLLKETGKGKDNAETLSLGPKKVLGDSAGNLGAAYFQTLYSKMNSQICLVTSIPDQYSIKNNIEEDERKYLKYPIVDDAFVQGKDLEQIKLIMAEILKKERAERDSIGIDYFGFKYSKILDKYSLSNAELLKLAGLSDSYKVEIHKGKNIFKYAEDDGEIIGDSATDVENHSIVTNNCQPSEKRDIPSFTPSQIIYYGVPGCGKSYEVNKVINDELDKYGVTDKEYHKVRCVFHPEYCNADFVGQIYPYVKPNNEGVEYRFKPGPFAEIVRRAYRNPAEPFFLIIEEINRGNAAAIFGEMFQLLDRIRPEDDPEELSGNVYNTGWSSYGVTNIDVNAYVRQKSTDNPEKIEYDDSIPYGNNIKFINNTAVRLPPNLSIYATMNTNDQNVFTMDNAFQRRFKSKMIRNVLDENSAQYKTEIDDTGVYWGDFREWINEKILLPQTAVLKADDKCLGGWFITGEKIGGVDKIKKEDFAEKVLKYLWDDVFKRNKSGEIFVKDDKVNSLSDLIDAFETSVGFESFEKIFKMNDVDKAKLQK